MEPFLCTADKWGPWNLILQFLYEPWLQDQVQQELA